mgnify:CR=1 FL=1
MRQWLMTVKLPFFGEQGIQDLKNGKYADNKWYKRNIP